MLNNGSRSCDVCYRNIAEGARYIGRKILNADIPSTMKIDFLAVDAQGNVEMDICLDCASITGVVE